MTFDQSEAGSSSISAKPHQVYKAEENPFARMSSSPSDLSIGASDAGYAHQQSTKWCFTVNNWTSDEHSYLRQLAWEQCVKYMIFGKEVGEQGTPHLQCFVQFHSNKRWSWVRTWLPARAARLQAANGTPWENREYCRKDGDFEEYGITPRETYSRSQAGGAANKRKWEDALASAKAGALDEIPADMLIRYYNTFQRIAKDFMTPPGPLEGPCGLWIHGTTGTGKSHAVHTQHPGQFY